MSAHDLPSRAELEALFAASARARMESAKAALREARVAPIGRPMLVEVAPGQWTVSFTAGLALMEALGPQERAQAEQMLAAAPEPPERKEEAQSDD